MSKCYIAQLSNSYKLSTEVTLNNSGILLKNVPITFSPQKKKKKTAFNKKG